MQSALRERAQQAYLYWMPLEQLSFSARYEHGRYSSEPVQLLGYSDMTTDAPAARGALLLRAAASRSAHARRTCSRTASSKRSRPRRRSTARARARRGPLLGPGRVRRLSLAESPRLVVSQRRQLARRELPLPGYRSDESEPISGAPDFAPIHAGLRLSATGIRSQNPNKCLASLYNFLELHIPQNNQNEVAGLMSEGIPTEADTRSEIAALLHEQFARLTRQLRTLELPQGMTPERLSALSVIEKRGPISVTALADKEMVRPATMSRMVVRARRGRPRQAHRRQERRARRARERNTEGPPRLPARPGTASAPLRRGSRLVERRAVRLDAQSDVGAGTPDAAARQVATLYGASAAASSVRRTVPARSASVNGFAERRDAEPWNALGCAAGIGGRDDTQVRLHCTRADQDIGVAAPEPVDHEQIGLLGSDGRQQILGARRHLDSVAEHLERLVNRRAKRFIQREHDDSLGTGRQCRQRHRSVVGIGRLLRRVTRQQQRHRRPLPDDALDRGAAARMLREPPHHAEPEARAAALALRREERLEHAASVSGGMPLPVSRTLTATCARRARARAAAPLASDTSAAATSIEMRPLPSMASRALTAKLTTTLSSCATLARTAPTFSCSVVSSVMRATQRTAQQRQQIADDLARIDGADVEVLAPRKRHELLDELGAALTGVARCLELLEHARSLTHLFADQVEIADQHGQQVVEVVRDSGGQAAERFHAGTVLRRGRSALLSSPSTNTPTYSPAGTLALHRQIAAKDSLRTVEPAQLDLDDAARARTSRQFAKRRLDQLIDEPLARCRLSIADAEEAPHTRVRTDDVAIELATTTAATTLLASRIVRSRSAAALGPPSDSLAAASNCFRQHGGHSPKQ